MKQVTQKEDDKKVDKKPLTPKCVEIKKETDLPVKREFIDLRGPGGRALRGPFGVY